MNYTQRASMSQKVRNSNMLIICIVASISVLGLVMAVYSVLRLKLLFALLYIAAVLLGFSYAVMKINTIMPTYIERQSDYLCIQNWENGLFPFRTDKGMIGEFIPAKAVLKKIDISAISRIYIGSRNYLLKLVDDGELKSILADSDGNYASMLKKMDFLYIKTIDSMEVFMSVTDYDEEELSEVFKPIVESNEKIDFRCNNRYISKAIPPKKFSI